MTSTAASIKASDEPSRPPGRRRMDHRKVVGLLLISPWLFGLLLFKLLPILASLGISFTNFHMLRPGETQFVGLDNYVQLFRDETVGFVLFQTIALAITSIPLQIVASISLAAILNAGG